MRLKCRNKSRCQSLDDHADVRMVIQEVQKNGNKLSKEKRMNDEERKANHEGEDDVEVEDRVGGSNSELMQHLSHFILQDTARFFL